MDALSAAFQSVETAWTRSGAGLDVQVLENAAVREAVSTAQHELRAQRGDHAAVQQLLAHLVSQGHLRAVWVVAATQPVETTTFCLQTLSKVSSVPRYSTPGHTGDALDPSTSLHTALVAIAPCLEASFGDALESLPPVTTATVRALAHLAALLLACCRAHPQLLAAWGAGMVRLGRELLQFATTKPELLGGQTSISTAIDDIVALCADRSCSMPSGAFSLLFDAAASGVPVISPAARRAIRLLTAAIAQQTPAASASGAPTVQSTSPGGMSALVEDAEAIWRQALATPEVEALAKVLLASVAAHSGPAATSALLRALSGAFLSHAPPHAADGAGHGPGDADYAAAAAGGAGSRVALPRDDCKSPALGRLLRAMTSVATMVHEEGLSAWLHQLLSTQLVQLLQSSNATSSSDGESGGADQRAADMLDSIADLIAAGKDSPLSRSLIRGLWLCVPALGEVVAALTKTLPLTLKACERLVGLMLEAPPTVACASSGAFLQRKRALSLCASHARSLGQGDSAGAAPTEQILRGEAQGAAVATPAGGSDVARELKAVAASSPTAHMLRQAALLRSLLCRACAGSRGAALAAFNFHLQLAEAVASEVVSPGAVRRGAMTGVHEPSISASQSIAAACTALPLWDRALTGGDAGPDDHQSTTSQRTRGSARSIASSMSDVASIFSVDGADSFRARSATQDGVLLNSEALMHNEAWLARGKSTVQQISILHMLHALLATSYNVGGQTEAPPRQHLWTAADSRAGPNEDAACDLGRNTPIDSEPQAPGRPSDNAATSSAASTAAAGESAATSAADAAADVSGEGVDGALVHRASLGLSAEQQLLLQSAQTFAGGGARSEPARKRRRHEGPPAVETVDIRAPGGASEQLAPCGLWAVELAAAPSRALTPGGTALARSQPHSRQLLAMLGHCVSRLTTSDVTDSAGQSSGSQGLPHPWKTSTPLLLARSALARGILELLSSRQPSPALPAPLSHALDATLRSFKLARSSIWAARQHGRKLKRAGAQGGRSASMPQPDAAVWAIVLLLSSAHAAPPGSARRALCELVVDALRVCTSLPPDALSRLVAVIKQAAWQSEATTTSLAARLLSTAVQPGKQGPQGSDVDHANVPGADAVALDKDAHARRVVARLQRLLRQCALERPERLGPQLIP